MNNLNTYMNQLSVVPNLEVFNVIDTEKFLNINKTIEEKDIDRLQQSAKRFRVKMLYQDLTSKDLICMFDKPNSHALLDCMISLHGEQIKSTFADCSMQEENYLLKTFSSFFKYCSQSNVIDKYFLTGACPRISYNIDPFTTIKPSIQDLKRLHIHYYLMEKKDLSKINKNKMLLGDLNNSALKKKLIDPLSFILAQIAFEYLNYNLKNSNAVSIIDPCLKNFITKGLPIGLNFTLHKGIKFLESHQFRIYFKEIFTALNQCYEELASIIFIHPFQYNTPIKKLNKLNSIKNRFAEIEWMSPSTKEEFLKTIATMKPFPRKVLKYLKKKGEWLAQLVPTQGLSYTVSLNPVQLIKKSNSKDIPFLLNIDFRFFSAVGGAGLFGINNCNAVLLNRGAGSFSKQDVIKRSQFQVDLSDHFSKEINPND